MLIISTVIGLFILVYIVDEKGGFDWQKSKYVYSFESDFDKYGTDADDCSYSSYYISCPDIIPDPTVAGGRLVQREREECRLIQEGGTPVKHYSSFHCGNLNLDTFIPRYCANTSNLDSVCRNEYTNDDAIRLMQDIFVFSAVAIGWMVLLKYGIYKAILYIAYGRK